MLVTILIWIYSAFLFLIYGGGMVALFDRLFSLKTEIPKSISVVMLLGLAMTAWLSSVLSLVMKLGLLAHLLVLAGALLILFFQYDKIKIWLLSAFQCQHWMVWALVLLVSITTLLYAAKPPSNADTPLYHAQAIHWMESYPAVPGLGNLDPRFGANSNWFSLIALFSFSFLGTHSFHLIPSFLFLLSLFYFLTGFPKLWEGDVRLSQIAKVGFIPVAYYVLIDEISSPGTDLPVILFYWVILCLWMEAIESRATSPLLQVFMFFFSVLTISFKLSGILILLIATQILFDLVKQKEYSLVLKLTGLAVVGLIPWIIRTFILTGYWLYPEPAMSLLSPQVDWRMPVERVLAFKRGVEAWALSPGTTWDDIADFSLLQRLRFWFSNLTINQKGITLIALISPAIWMFFSSFPKRNDKRISYTLVMVLSFINFLFWLLTAPNYRFGYGFVLGLIVPVIAMIALFLFERFVNYRYYLLVAIALLLSIQQVHVILGSARDGTRYLNYVLLPADYAPVPTDACSLDGKTISCARRYRQCGYDAFPCLAQIPKNVQLRGDTFRDGFRRIVKNP